MSCKTVVTYKLPACLSYVHWS